MNNVFYPSGFSDKTENVNDGNASIASVKVEKATNKCTSSWTQKSKWFQRKGWQSLVLLSILFASVAKAQNGKIPNAFVNRTILNGLGNSTVRGVVSDGSTVYAATSGGGVGVSTNYGSSFTARTVANSGLSDNTVFDVYLTGTTLYAATLGGLSKSTDGGNTFTVVLPNKTCRAVFASGDNVYAATSADGLAISTNGGGSFTYITTANGLGNNSTYDVCVVGSKIYVATQSAGLSISTDGGSTWTTSTVNAIASQTIRGLYVVGNTVYAASNSNGLYISTDGGSTFPTNKTTADGLGNNNMLGVYILGSTIYLATNNGLDISTNGCATFTNYLAGNTTYGVFATNATPAAVFAGTLNGLQVGADPAYTRGATTFSAVSDPINAAFQDGVTYQLSGSSNSPTPILFTSATTTVATVSTTGLITLKKPGTSVITISLPDDPYYLGNAGVSFTLTVDKGNPSITTIPTASSLTYGQTLASSTLSSGQAKTPAGTATPGIFRYSTPTTIPNAGTTTQSITFTPSNLTNFNIATGTVSITVAKANTSITTAPTASSIAYGQTLANSILSGGAGSVAGTFAFTTPSTTPGLGTSTQSYTFTPTDATNYNTSTGTVSVTVTKATPSITTVPTASNITIGQTLASSILSGGVANVAGTFAFTTPSTAPSVGTANQGFTFTPTDGTNYNTTTGTVSVTVNLPSFTYNFSGNHAFRDLGAVLTNVNTSQFNSSQVYSFDNNAWAAYSGVMTPGKGYRVLVDGSATPTINITGNAVLAGNQSTTLAGGQNKFSFIANPYQAQVDFNALTKSGLYAGFWYLNPKNLVGGYEQYDYFGSNLGSSNIYSGNATSRYLQAGQGFFVCSNTTGTPSLTFTEASKYTGAAPVGVFGVTAPLNRIATGLFKNGNNLDGAVVVFNNSFSKNVAEEDGFKIDNNGENLTFAVAGKELCANGWNMPTASDVLPMHLYNLKANTAYTLKLDASGFYGNGLSAYLQDNVLNKKVLLSGANNEVSFTTGSNVASDANRYGIVFGSSTLPVKSISLTATPLNNKQVSVKWTTVGESNLASYTIERSSNGLSFVAIATVKAGENSYSYKDESVNASKVVYYRIKATENGGAVSYSKVVNCEFSMVNYQLSIAPNPVINGIFKLGFATTGKYSVTLIDKLGKTVYSTTVNHTTAAALENIALSNKLAAGSYTLKATDENGLVSTKQLIIK